MRLVPLYLISVLLFVTVWHVSGYATLNKEWQEFKQEYGKNYSSKEEEAKKKLNFEANHAYVKQHNKEAGEGKHTFTCAINAYSDLSENEFGKLITNLKISENITEPSSKANATDSVESRAALPESVDWRKSGYVTGVKNQGECGSCWAYAAAAALEAYNFKATGKLVLLSDQHLLDCVYPGTGCNGGHVRDAFSYVQKNGGIATEAAYPNRQTYSGGCKFQQNTVGGTASGFVSVLPQGSEAALQQSIATVGPATCSIDGSKTTFQHYKAGVYSETSCSAWQSNHVALVVGYGSSNGQAYWTIKNSWGTSWGDKGYMYMSRNNNNNCGVASYAYYPTVAAQNG